MLKSLQQKLVLMFVMLITAIMIIIGTFIFNNVMSFYHTEFREQMLTIFNESLVEQLDDAALSNEPVKNINIITEAFAGSIGVDTYRNYYILERKSGKCLESSEHGVVPSIKKTAVVIDAMAGQGSYQTDISGSVMEYALPLGDGYILYIVDTKEEMNDVLKSMLTILLQSLLLGIAIAVILGYILSKTITTPIIGLTKRADKLAKGEFESFPGVPEKDELGILSNTFKYMSETLSNTLEEIAFEKDKLETVMQYMSDGIIAFDQDGSIIVINPAAKNFLGIENASGIEFDSYFGEKFDEIKLGDFIYFGREKKEERLDESGEYALKFYFSSFSFENDRRGVMVVIQDVTEQQAVENSRREFVANVSHELKTPITTVKSYAETLLENEVDRETEESFLKVINREADRMTRLVRDLLTLSRLDSKVMLQNREYINIYELAESVIENQLIEIKKHKHKINLCRLNELPLVYTDKDRVEQVLTNILSNAVKYTPDDGKIEVFVSFFYGNVYVKVKDNGIGIPEADQQRIFERFYRVDKARSREQGGTGLGLAIAREMLVALGGDILLESRQGEGTEVCIVLPVEGKKEGGRNEDMKAFKRMKG